MLRWLIGRLWVAPGSAVHGEATSVALPDRSDLSEFVRLIREIDLSEANPVVSDDDA